jgi:S-adenosylhomocysteine hydrolase
MENVTTLEFKKTGLRKSPSLSPVLPALEILRGYNYKMDASVGAIFGLQHLFGSTATLIKRLAGDQVPAGNVLLLGKPYSTNPGVAAHLSGECGYWVHPDSIYQPEDRENDSLMDERIKQVLEILSNGIQAGGLGPRQRVLLVDDGGRAVRLLHSDRFANIRSRFVCVEQTRAGIRTLDDVNLEVPVVNVAESWVKLQHESPMIAESVVTELDKKLAELRLQGVRIPGKAAIIGFGAIGQAVAAELTRKGMAVGVYDQSQERRAAALSQGYPTFGNLRNCIQESRVVVGCTGLPVLGQEDYPHIADGSVLISASSADVEFQAWNLRSEKARVASTEGQDHPCFSLYGIDNGKGRFHLVNGGFPVNFTGGVDPIHPNKIQLTRCLLYLAAVQASWSTEKGIIPLDDYCQTQLLDIYNQARKQQAA